MGTTSGGEASYVGGSPLPVGGDNEVIRCRGREDGQGNDFAQEGPRPAYRRAPQPQADRYGA